MSRRKGEGTGHMNEREFPHLVELELPRGGFRSQNLEFDAFHGERGIPIRVAAAGMRCSNSISASASSMPPLLMPFTSASAASASLFTIPARASRRSESSISALLLAAQR
jgi:hypothetical protein